MMSRMTLGAFFNIRANSLNSLRLLFATLVIVSHSWPVGGFGWDPRLGDFKLGEFSVAAFFVISGYLITGSRLNSDLIPFFRARIVRIFPGFWVCLIVTAFVAAPIAGAVRGGWSLGDAGGYVVKNLTLVMKQWTVGGTLEGAPWPQQWNGPLWTLMYEFACYVMVAILFSIPALRGNRWAVLAVFAVFTIGTSANHFGYYPDNFNIMWMTIMGTYFFAGATVFMFRDVIPASPWLMAGAVAVIVGLCALHAGMAYAPLPIAYACIWVAARCPKLLVERIGSGTTDISYGMYVYGWVVQQLVVLIGLNEYGVAVMIAASVIGTIPFALASWYLVERPALKYKKGRPRKIEAPVTGGAHRMRGPVVRPTPAAPRSSGTTYRQ